MRTIYRVLAYLIAALVAVQAAVMALGVFGLFAWIQGGSVLDKAAMESNTTDFAGVGGFELHGTFGMSVVPVVGLVLLVVSFFTKMTGATRWALLVVASIICQVLLGIFAHEIYWLGALHGLFAFILLACAVVAGRRMVSRNVTAATITTQPVKANADIS
ncbi:hypothetical protein [Tessaracoccus antarcticus]|uniref:hypothetical protein n=1 Tax=Tessaracoccus antarcticus TaxID=2479848 RepID=UPI0018F510B2|nr:hypothetical protein [Tessaracoccus antarcticus]